MTHFSFDAILRGMPLPDGVRRPSGTRSDIAKNPQGAACWRVFLVDPAGAPSCFGLGWTPEHAFRTALVGLLTELEEHTGKATAEARAFVTARTLN